MTSHKTPLWAIASILLSAALALVSLTHRYSVEERNKAVTLAAEWEAISALAAGEGFATDQALARMQAAGMNGVTISEDTIGALQDQGKVRLSTSQTPGTARLYTVVASHPSHAQRVRAALESRFRGKVSEAEGGLRVEEVPPAAILETPAGLDPEACAAINRLSLVLIARLANPPGMTNEAVRASVASAARLGAQVYLPVGEQVLGRRESMKSLLEALESGGMLYASPEFARIGGDANVLRDAPNRVVRLHAAQPAEMDKLTLPDAVERYSRAASERNVRVLLLRPLSLSSERPLESFAQLCGAVQAQVVREGLSIEAAHSFDDPEVPAWLFPAIGLAAAPALFYAGAAIPFGTLWQAVVGLLVLTLGIGAYLPQVRPYCALAAAAGFPFVAFLIVDAGRKRPPALNYALATLISLAGGLCVAGLLNGLPYFVKAQQFTGVKLAHFLPVAAVGAYMLWRLTDLRGALRSSVNWTQAVIAIALLGAIAFMAIRTGNENPSAVSDLELRLRSLLDALLQVRPRTKEVFLGHPAMVVGLGMLAGIAAGRLSERKLAGWTVFALMLGAIGQTSVVNTLCHLHTPLAVGLTRIGIGFAVGGILGGLLWAALRRALPKEEGLA